MHPMRLTMITAITLLVACDGTGSGLMGISTGGGGGTDNHTVAFTVPPSGAEVRDIITPAIQVAVLDTSGNPDPNFVGTVSVALGTNVSGGFLSGSKTVAAVSGIAAFGDLSLDRAGTYTLVASATGAGSATSAAFTILPATP